MAAASLSNITAYCERLLRNREFNDWEGAVNGLQVENGGRVSKIAASVDASLATVRLAVAEKADLMIVHHGLFWSAKHPWVGRNYELMRLLIENGVAVYSSHLPLDAHPRLGNNARLCAALGFKRLRPFFFEKGRCLGFQTSVSLPLATLAKKLGKILGKPPTVLPGGPSVCKRVGVVTGGAGNSLKVAASEGMDTFITGEGAHWTHSAAEELGINVLYGGHYATETFGVKALAAELSSKFKIPWVFVDHPSGL